MTKKATLRDVAKMAGVSVATVSYVINERPDQKISEATRKKVLQIANLLDYRPNPTAKSLAEGRNNLIAIFCHLRPDTPFRNLEIIHFAQLLTERLNRLRYDALLCPVRSGAEAKDSAIAHHNVGCVIAIGLSMEEFSELSDNCYVPILCVDMLVNHFLFYQIYSDLPARIRQAAQTLQGGPEHTVLVTEPFHNQNYQEFVLRDAPVKNCMVLSADQWKNAPKEGLLSHPEKDCRYIVLGSALAQLVIARTGNRPMAVISSDPTGEFLPPQASVILNDVVKKANVTISILLNALDKKFDVTHDYRI